MMFSKIKDAIKDISEGKIVVVTDDESRENEGDFVMAAEKVTPEAINFMARYGRGLICMPCQSERLKELQIPMMVDNNNSRERTAFTVSIGAKNKITTGISARDRSVTIQTVMDPRTSPEDISMPGHVFPLVAKDGGVLVRAGHTEAAADLAKLAGFYPAGVICEIMNDDGTMARMPELVKVAEQHNLKMVTIKDLIRYRRSTEKLVRKVIETKLPTRYGTFNVIAYESQLDGAEHIALVKGDVAGKKNVMVRVHSECLTGDVFHSLRCDCGAQMEESLRKIEENGEGVFLYMVGHEGRGIGLVNKLRAYSIQEQGKDTVEANQALGFGSDLRDYGIGAQILVDLGITTMHLMTNNPRKIVGLEGYGLKITGRVPIEIQPNPENRDYLKAKKDKLFHLLKSDELQDIAKSDR